jgi:hypothetical protein
MIGFAKESDVFVSKKYWSFMESATEIDCPVFLQLANSSVWKKFFRKGGADSDIPDERRIAAGTLTRQPMSTW